MKSSLYSTAILLIVVMTACGTRATPSPLTTIVRPDEFVTRSTLAELVKASETIIVGTVRSESGTRNMARNAEDRLKEDSFYVVLGQDYVIDVEDVLKGEAGTQVTFTLARAHGDVQNGLVADRDFIPLRIGQRYLMFLNPQNDGTAGFVPAPEPFRFMLSATAVPESRWQSAGTLFAPRSVAQLILEVRQAVQ